MATADLDRHYATFRRTRDPEALAAVFDATAPRLLLIAVHLVGDRTEAEDLVQQTFVEAIQKAEQWDSNRGVEPWLVGVLANRAKTSIRSRRRRPAQSDDREGVDSTPGPSQIAESREVASRVSEAIDGLPEKYRHVLILNLVHGLSGVQIAQSLGRPPATVRTQIHRGLEMLRSALPIALGVPAALLALEGRGLAAVRAAVVEHAAAALKAAGVATGAGATSGAVVLAAGTGVLLMKKALVTTAAIVVLGAGAWLASRSWITDGERASSGPAMRSEASTADLEIAADLPARSTVESSPSADPSSRAEVADDDGASTLLTGRCVDAANGAPIALAELSLQGYPRDSMQMNDDPTRWPLVAATNTTDAQGAFTLEFGADESLRWSLQVQAPGFVQAHGGVTVEAGAAKDLGDLKLRRGAIVRPSVVDAAGDPVQGVTVVFEPEITALFTGTGTTMFGGRSDASGSIEMAVERILPGQWPVRVDSAFQLLRPHRLIVPEGMDLVAPIFVVARRTSKDTIRGRVLEPNGSAATGAHIEVAGRTWDSSRRLVSADASGAFTLYREDGENDAVTLRVSHGAGWLPSLSERVRWGDDELEIVLEPARQLTLEVVDELGQSIESYGIARAWDGDRDLRFGGASSIESNGRHEGGRLTITGIGSAGQLRLLVVPADDEFALPDPIELDLGDPLPSVQRVVVAQPPSFDAVVRLADGTLVAGSTIEVVQLRESETLDANTLVLPRDAIVWNFRNSMDDWPVAFTRHTATSDEQGRAVLRCPTPATRIGLRVTGPHHPDLVVAPFAPPTRGDETVVLTVAQGATIRGVVGPDGFRRSFVRRAERADPGTLLRSVQLALRAPESRQVHSSPHDIGPNGRFEITGMAPGTWEVVGYWWRPTEENTRQATILEPPLATVTVASGETVDLALDLSSHRPGTIEGRVLHDGRPVAAAKISFVVRRTSPSGREIGSEVGGDIETDEDGEFVVAGLVGGDYQLRAIALDDDGVERARYASGWIHVDDGRRVRHTFTLVGRTVRITLRTPGGAPAATRPVTVLCDELCRAWTASTDSAGVVEIPDAPPSVLRVLVHEAGSIHERGAPWTTARLRRGQELEPIIVSTGSGPVDALLDTPR